MGNNTYLNKLREKCKISDELMQIIYNFFDSLIDFGYVSKSKINRLAKKMYENVDTVLIGDDIIIDYKSGYYDAAKKELYIKDIQNLESVYLRLLYIISTSRMSDDSFAVGYSNTKYIPQTGTILHKNFAINRAVLSNLVCRLLYTSPITLSIMPTYRTYENNFLGYSITSDNDIYFLEGNIFSLICYTLDIDEEEMYYNIFSPNPNKYLASAFKKTKLKDYEIMLDFFDRLSKKYSNYSKLCYLEKLLNENYINIKKNILNNDVSIYEKETQKIKAIIHNTLSKFNSNYELDSEEEFDYNIESSLSERLNILEEEIIELIKYMQDIFINYCTDNKTTLNPIDYAAKIKHLDNLLLVVNEKIKEELYNTITNDILINQEHSSTNLTEKIKYSVINELLGNDKFEKTRRNMNFRVIKDITTDSNIRYIIIEMDNNFVELARVSNLNDEMRNLIKNVDFLKADNFKYLLHTNLDNKNTSKYEKIFSKIKSKYKEFNTVTLDDIYYFKDNELDILLVISNKDFNILKLEYTDKTINTKKFKLSESFSIFKKNNSSNLPAIQKEKNIFKKFLSLFSTF